MHLKTMLSQRGRTLLICENNFKYSKYKEISTGETVWRCTQRPCLAKIYTLGTDLIYSKKVDDHEHNSLDISLINRQIVGNSVKRKAEDLLEAPSKLIHREISEHKETINTLTTKDIRCIKKSLYRSKLKKFPTLPKNREEIHQYFASKNIVTIREESFVLTNDSTTNIILFSTKTNLEYLCRADIIFLDGTFDYCCKYFLQLYTLHIFYRDTYVPVAFYLLKDKSMQTYVNMLNDISSKANDLGLQFNPGKIVVDFEKATHQAIKIVFPTATIIGCRFHLGQAW